MILQLRDFDEQLRHLLWPFILQVEIRFRTHIAYYIAHQFGPLGYREITNFLSATYAQEIIDEIDTAIKKSEREVFIQHYKQCYNSEFPIWVIVEVLPFGVLSKLFSNLHDADKTNITKEHYGLDGRVVNSYLTALSAVRNICAHNGRVYNKTLPIGIKISTHNKKKLQTAYGAKYLDFCTFSGTLFDRSLFTILLALRDLTPKSSFENLVGHLEHLINQYNNVVCPQRLGFPPYWKDFLLS